VGFDWPDPAGPRDKIEEELGELDAACKAGDAENTVEELGDLLFTVVNLARHLKIDPEQALTAANRKFERRFRSLEREIIAAGQAIRDQDLETLESHWQSAKDRRS
jgi:ATP diphosphatase